jgi:hypothetical protein
LELVQFCAGQNVGASLDQFDNDVQSVVDGPVVIVDIRFDVLNIFKFKKIVLIISRKLKKNYLFFHLYFSSKCNGFDIRNQYFFFIQIFESFIYIIYL